jgi:AraC-like DNA-binding protein
MLLSRRRHLGPQQSRAEVGRAITPHWLARSVVLNGLTQDERLTYAALRQDVARPRARIIAVLAGECHTTSSAPGAELVTLRAGTVFFAEPGKTLLSRVSHAEVLELEWDGDSGCASGTGTVKLAPRVLEKAHALHTALRNEERHAAIAAHVEAFVAGLEALGIEAQVAAHATTVADQRLMNAVDGQLSQLAAAPMLVDLSAALHTSERSLTRRILALHEQHQLTGRGRTWRAQRDMYRLIMASLFATEPNITQRELAALSGYGSVEALDHAFRNAGLPSPRLLRSRVRAA